MFQGIDVDLPPKFYVHVHKLISHDAREPDNIADVRQRLEQNAGIPDIPPDKLHVWHTFKEVAEHHRIEHAHGPRLRKQWHKGAADVAKAANNERYAIRLLTHW